MTIQLRITDKDGFIVGYAAPRAGMKTDGGLVTRFTERTLWTQGKYGERMHRICDGDLPSVRKSWVRKSDIRA